MSAPAAAPPSLAVEVAGGVDEAKAVAALEHPNILAVHDTGRDGGRPYVVSELLEGQTLRQRIEGRPLRLVALLELAIQIADALEAEYQDAPGLARGRTRLGELDGIGILESYGFKVLPTQLATSGEEAAALAFVLPTTWLTAAAYLYAREAGVRSLENLIKKIMRKAAIRIASDSKEKVAVARADLDAVMLAVPDHWHGIMAIAAARTGKDIYCEKPLGHNIVECKAMVAAVRRYNRIFQTGSMQRSSNEFRVACEYVRSGRIGKRWRSSTT